MLFAIPKKGRLYDKIIALLKVLVVCRK